MFFGKVVYEKKFPSFEEEVEKDIEEYAQEKQEDTEPPKERKRLTYKQIVAEITKNNTYVPMPNRLVSGKDFMDLAVRISDELEMDLKIVQGEYEIEAVFQLDWFQHTYPLKILFAIADDYRFKVIDDKAHMSITFVYYTHLVITHDRLFHPNF